MSGVRWGQGPLGADALADWYAVPEADLHPRWVRGSFIASLDGRATGPGGRSGGLNAGSAGDHAAFAGLREWADVVVVGAGTARSEGYGPLETSPLVVVSRSGDLPTALVDDPDVHVAGGQGEPVGPEQVLALIEAYGWRRVVLEGGPALFAEWVAAGQVDELCLTIRPVLVGGDGPLLLPTEVALPGLLGSATHVLEWEGDLLLRIGLTA